MRKQLVALALVLLIAGMAGLAAGETVFEYTYFDEAKTQIKTETRIEDGVTRFRIEFHFPGADWDNASQTFWDEDGKLINKHTNTFDAQKYIYTHEFTYYNPDTGKVSHSSSSTNLYDEDGNYIRQLMSSWKYYDEKTGVLVYESSQSLDPQTYTQTYESTSYYPDTGKVSSSSVEVRKQDEDGNWEQLSYSSTGYDEAGRVTNESTEDNLGNRTSSNYTYDKDGELVRKQSSVRKIDLKTEAYTEESVTTDGSGNVLERGERKFTPKYDTEGAFLEGTVVEVTKYYDKAGELVKTDYYTEVYDAHWGSPLYQKWAVSNERDVLTSYNEYARKRDEAGYDTGSERTSALFDSQSGDKLASITITSDTELNEMHNIKSIDKTSVNQDGITVAAYTLAHGEDGKTTETYRYFNEQTGKLRQSVDTLSGMDDKGQWYADSTTRNAAGVVTESLATRDKEFGFTNTLKKYDSVTGKLKSTTVAEHTFDPDYQNVWTRETLVTNATGGPLSRTFEDSYVDDQDRHITDTQYTKYDPVSGEMLGKSRVVDMGWHDGFSSTIRYDQDDNKVHEWYNEPILDEEGKHLGNRYGDIEYDESGQVSWAYISEHTEIFTEDGNYLGSDSVTKDAHGNIMSTNQYRPTWDEDGTYLGFTETEMYYHADGSLEYTDISTSDRLTGVNTYVRKNAKGNILSESKTTGEHGRRTYVENSYSEHTGNLMTTVTRTSREETTGEYQEHEERVKAGGQLVRVSDLLYMLVDEYGYLHYDATYTDYLYRADGSLKYTIQGRDLMDNFYHDLFNKDADSYYMNPTETLETTTAASGVITREYHFLRDLEDGWDTWDYTEETKVYDEKTGALKFITTETQDFDPDTGETRTTSRTLSAEGKLLAESTSLSSTDVNDRDHFLGRESVGYNQAGQLIHSFQRDEKGNWSSISKTYSEESGKLIMEEQRVSGEDGGDSSQVFTYDEAGQVLRRVVNTSRYGEDKSSAVSEVYDGAGQLIERTETVDTYHEDGTMTTRMDKKDEAGNTTFTQSLWGPDADMYLNVLLKRTRTYYDAQSNLRKEVVDGNKTTVYDGQDKVLSISTLGEDGNIRTTDGAGNLLYYTSITDAGDLPEFYANGKPRLAIARDDDGEVRRTSFDNEGYINYVSIEKPGDPFTMVYDGDGHVAEIFYHEGYGRSAYYDANAKQWYNTSDNTRTAISTPDFAAAIDMSQIETGGQARPKEEIRPRGSWYPDNTSCTFGIHLRDIMPELTDKWYTVSPIDLSQDGVQHFELVGGNMWIIGQVNVQVRGDEVTVSYDIIKDGRGRTTVSTEYLNIFSDLGSITLEALEGDSQEGKGYQFGAPISIEQDLGGDTNVLLYVRNVVTFNTRVYGDQFLTRMWPNVPERKERREAMILLMDPLVAPLEEESVAPGN